MFICNEKNQRNRSGNKQLTGYCLRCEYDIICNKLMIISQLTD